MLPVEKKDEKSIYFEFFMYIRIVLFNNSSIKYLELSCSNFLLFSVTF